MQDKLLQLLQLDDLHNTHGHLFQPPGQNLTDHFADNAFELLVKYVRAALLRDLSVMLLQGWSQQHVQPVAVYGGILVTSCTSPLAPNRSHNNCLAIHHDACTHPISVVT